MNSRCFSSLSRQLSRLLIATTLTAAALPPGAVVFAVEAGVDCLEWSPPTEATVTAYPLIVVGTVESVDQAAAIVHTESILRGSAQGTSLSLAHPGAVGLCGNAVLETGQRVLLMLRVEGGRPLWPTVDQTYYLKGTAAESANETAGTSLLATDLIQLITGETDQVVVPAQFESEGESIEWTTTILPIAVALGIVFVIGLFLMRIWHRIDPS